MSDLTNSSASIYRRTKNWEGQAQAAVLVGTYDVWQEDLKGVRHLSPDIGGALDVKEQARGFIVIYEDIDLTDCYVSINSTEYKILDFDRYVDENSDFIHIEIYYR